MAANGSFTYHPPVGYEGSDAFTYTLSNGGGTDTDAATVNVTVSDMVWFLDATASGPGTGSFADPFNTIAGFNSANALSGAVPNPKAGDVISLSAGAYNEASGINLRDGQVLIGEAVQLNTEFAADANSLAAYQAFAGSTGAAPTIAASAGHGISLGSDNTIRGVTIGDTSGSGISGNTFGTLTVTDVTVWMQGQ